jgi:Ca-activated chloride channel family protein
VNLEHPWYLLIPVISVIIALFIKKSHSYKDLSKIADPHLLKYIIHIPVRQNTYKYLCMLGIISLLSLAMANPRWGEREYKLYNANAAAVIILDVSNHMGCQDIKPTRSIRARQIASEIVKNFKQVNFGLLAFAKNTHLIAPITEDQATLNNYLPAIDYRLVYQQGQELDSSIALANEMLDNEATHKKSIILLSSGNFNLKNFKAKYPIYTIGIGTEQGAPMHDLEDQHIYVNGQLQITKLDSANLKKLAIDTGGKYFSYIDMQRDVKILNKYLISEHLQAGTENTVKTWNDGYAYILALAALLIALSLQRGVIVLSLAAIVFLPINHSEAIELANLFKNHERQAFEAVERLDFEFAAKLFVDPYNQGVSLFKIQQYEQAIQAFKNNKRPEVNLDALYNMGNSYYMLEQYNLAIESYEQVLELNPDHLDAKFNLELARKKLKEQPEKDCQCDNDKDKSKKEQQQKNSTQKNQRDDLANQESSEQEQNNEQSEKGSKQESSEQEQNNEQSEKGSKQESSEQEKQNANDTNKTQEQASAALQEQQDNQDNQDAQEQLALEQQQKWLQQINADISNFLKTRMYIDDLKSNK